MFLYFFILFYFRITKKANKNLQLSNEIIFLLKESNKKHHKIQRVACKIKLNIMITKILEKLFSLDSFDRILVGGFILQRLLKNYSFFFKFYEVAYIKKNANLYLTNCFFINNIRLYR